MKLEQPPGPPATLGEVRWLDARSLLASCKACAHETVLNVEALADSVPLSWFATRFVCRCCNASALIFSRAGRTSPDRDDVFGTLTAVFCWDEQAVMTAVGVGNFGAAPARTFCPVSGQ